MKYDCLVCGDQGSKQKIIHFGPRTNNIRLGENYIFVKLMHHMEPTPVTEDYLKAIYTLAEESQPVIAARVAEEIGVSP